MIEEVFEHFFFLQIYCFLFQTPECSYHQRNLFPFFFQFFLIWIFVLYEKYEEDSTAAAAGCFWGHEEKGG